MRRAVSILIAVVCSGCLCTPPLELDAGTDAGAPAASSDSGPGRLTCSDWGAECGLVGDGVGGTLTCGTCLAPKTCGGGGIPLRCGQRTPDAGLHDGGACTPRTCAELGANCGDIPSDCGGAIDCGDCADAGRCSGNVCVGGPSCGDPQGCCPASCEWMGWDCGIHPDGCGGVLQCGTCEGGLTCGGGAFASRCGRPASTTPPCQARACFEVGASCGWLDDGCGHSLRCGECDDAWGICGALVANVCAWRGFVDRGFTDCASLGPERCGFLSDGDGGLTDCGTCDAGRTCGAIVPNLCGF